MRDATVREHVARAEQALAAIEDDPRALEAVQGLVELYGEALRRIVARGGTAGLEGDELVSHLLLVHDLHPVDVETRVLEALAGVRPYLESHGGDVELLGVDGGVARIRLRGTCDGCPSSTATLRHAIEEAIGRAAPELEGVEAEGAVEPREKPKLLLQIAPLECPAELQRA
jgi:Fe-S cluster biogenesis protein NfuA